MNVVRRFLASVRARFLQERKSRVGLYCAGALQELERLGYVRVVQGGVYLSAQGISAWDQLRASGFRPRSREITEFLLEKIGDTPAIHLERISRSILELDRILQEEEAESDEELEEEDF